MDIPCLLVDDERHALDVLISFIRRTPGLELSGAFTEPEKALHAATLTPPGLAFLDVDMPGISGMELAERLPAGTIIVYTTAYREFAADAYEQAAADYLLKPILYERFLKCVSRVIQKQKEEPACLYVKDAGKGSTIRILYEEVLYISAALNYLELHLQHSKVLVYAGIGEFEKQLPAFFLRIHRSHIVNRQHIRTASSRAVVLSDGTLLPVSRNHAAAIMNAVK